MSCEELRRQLDDLVDGELPAAEAAACQAHLGACEKCRAEMGALLTLRRAARELPPTIEPSQDLWPGIAARIGVARVDESVLVSTRSWRRLDTPWLRLAATLLLAVGLGLLLWRGLRPAMTSNVALETGARQAARPSSSGVLLAAAELDSVRVTYGKARQELTLLLAAQRSTLSPATVKVVEDNLKVIDDAVARIQSALAADPGNRELSTLLLGTYRQELALLGQVSTLMART